MDDGVKTAALIFRIGLAAKEMMLKMVIEVLKAIVKHMEWLKQHNIKPSWKARIDKAQIKFVQATTTLVEKQIEISKQKVIQKEREIDKFKLDKQYELEKYKTEVYKAQKALDLAHEGKDSIDITTKQNLLDKALENKKTFEYKTNQEIMAKNHELDNCKNESSQFEYDLKVCNAKLNALYSYQNIETGRVKREYQDIKDKYVSQDQAVDLQQEEEIVSHVSSLDEIVDKFETKPSEQEKEHQKQEEQDIDNTKKDVEVDIVEQMLSKDAETLKAYKELYGTNDRDVSEVSEKPIKDIENNVEDSKEVDIVEQMFAKDPKALKVYQESKAKGDFKMNVPQLSKSKGIDI